MRDADVRAALHEQLRAEHAHELGATRFLDELSLCGEVRVDVAVLNGELAGYELKSARDTLRRLPTQVGVYSRVLDRASLVVSESHRAAAGALLPAWWGLIVACESAGGTGLVWERHPTPNPAIDSFALAQLLWREEVLGELEARGLDRGVRSSNRAVLWSRLVASVTQEELRRIVRERLKRRTGWRVAPSPSSGDGASRSGAKSSESLRLRSA